MANEITRTASLRIAKSNVNFTKSFSKQITFNGSDIGVITQSISSSTHQALTFAASIGTKGCAYLLNTDSTNYIEVGTDQAGTFAPLLRVNAGEDAQIRWSQSATPYAKANTAAVTLEHGEFED